MLQLDSGIYTRKKERRTASTVDSRAPAWATFHGRSNFFPSFLFWINPHTTLTKSKHFLGSIHTLCDCFSLIDRFFAILAYTDKLTRQKNVKTGSKTTFLDWSQKKCYPCQLQPRWNHHEIFEDFICSYARILYEDLSSDQSKKEISYSFIIH